MNVVMTFLVFSNLEKAYESLEHSVFLDSLFDAGIKGRAWRIITMLLLNLVASFPYHSLYVLCGVKLDSFLSPTFF